MRWLLTILTILSGAGFFAAEKPLLYSNAEIEIDFSGPFQVRIEPGSTVYRDALARPLQTVDFCQWQGGDPEVQQVSRPESGFLCEMHLLHPRSVNDWMTAIRAAAVAKRTDRGRTFDLTYSEIHGLRVIQWRFQAGKTRLDHYILMGKKYHYLFISSPYGSNGAIEDMLARTKLR